MLPFTLRFVWHVTFDSDRFIIFIIHTHTQVLFVKFCDLFFHQTTLYSVSIKSIRFQIFCKWIFMYWYCDYRWHQVTCPRENKPWVASARFKFSPTQRRKVWSFLPNNTTTLPKAGIELQSWYLCDSISPQYSVSQPDTYSWVHTSTTSI